MITAKDAGKAEPPKDADLIHAYLVSRTRYTVDFWRSVPFNYTCAFAFLWLGFLNRLCDQCEILYSVHLLKIDAPMRQLDRKRALAIVGYDSGTEHKCKAVGAVTSFFIV